MFPAAWHRQIIECLDISRGRDYRSLPVWIPRSYGLALRNYFLAFTFLRSARIRAEGSIELHNTARRGRAGFFKAPENHFESSLERA
jgi:hypothetical protein